MNIPTTNSISIWKILMSNKAGLSTGAYYRYFTSVSLSSSAGSRLILLNTGNYYMEKHIAYLESPFEYVSTNLFEISRYLPTYLCQNYLVFREVCILLQNGATKLFYCY